MDECLVIDVELSGMRAFDSVIEFAACHVSAKEYNLISNTWISGAIDILPSQLSLLGITQNDYECSESRSLEAVLQPLLLKYSTIPWLSYNIDFDFTWLYHSLVMNGADHEAAKLSDIQTGCLLEHMIRQTGQKRKLEEWLQGTDSSHRALNDVRKHIQLMKRYGMPLKKNWTKKTIDELV